MKQPALTAARLDAILEGRKMPSDFRTSSLATESLWGAQRIADFMGVSDDFVRKLARDRAAPIRVKGGRYFTTKSEVVAWLMPGAEERA